MEYLIHIAILFCIYAILSLSLNLLVGYTGLLSITHAAFYGMGAYTTAILTVNYHWNFFVSVVAGAILTGILSLVIGAVMSKFKDDYYALASFGFNIIMFSIFLNWDNLTRGPLGIPGIRRPEVFNFVFSDNALFLMLAIIFAGLIYMASDFIVNSSFGRALKAIREDEKALQVFGYNVIHYKLAIFVMSAMMAAIAGSLFAAYISYIDPSSFTLHESVFVVAIIILGGLASLKGSLLGTLFLILLPEVLRFVGLPTDIAAQMRQVIYGVILVLLMLYRPKGLVGEYELR